MGLSEAECQFINNQCIDLIKAKWADKAAIKRDEVPVVEELIPEADVIPSVPEEQKSSNEQVSNRIGQKRKKPVADEEDEEEVK